MPGEAGERGTATALVPPPSDPWLGRVIAGRYRVVDFMASGGMGRIYRAEQEPLGRMVALKVLNPRYTTSGDDPEFQKRFLLEAATYAKLHHPNVVTIFDYGRVEGEDTYYMAMEFIVGRTLSQALRAEGPMPPRRVIGIARQIGRALREAHRLGIVHRDLKPSNVMLVQNDEGESVKVLDFGLVKVLRDDSEDLTMEGKFLGSPKYMSPEQIRHHAVDARSDLYSLGIIMFELLSGKVPFEGTQAVQTLMMHVSQPPPSLRERGANVSLELEGVVQRCLAKEPEQRFADVDEFMVALRIASAQASDEPSYDPLRSSTGTWGLTSSSDMMVAPKLSGSSGSVPTISGSGSGSGSYPGSGSQPGSFPGSQPGSYPGSGSQPGSFPGSGNVTAPRPAEIPRSAPPPRTVAPPARSIGAFVVGGAIIVAAAVLGVLLSRGSTNPPPAAPSTGALPPAPAATPPTAPRPPEGAQHAAPNGPGQTATDPAAATPATGTSPGATPTANGGPSPSAPAVGAAPASTVVLRLRSVPEGDVYEGEHRLGSTPLEVPLDPAATAARTFDIRRPAFRSEEVRVEPTTTSVERSVHLRRAPVASAPRPPRPPSSAPPTPPPERPRPNPDLDIRTAR